MAANLPSDPAPRAYAHFASAATATVNADKAKAEPKKIDVGAVAAMGVAFGAMGTALAYFAGLFKGIEFWQLCLAIVAILLVISGPSMILAWMKLRKRNLGPILDANGWAVNAKAKLNVPFGASLTGVAQLPPGAAIGTDDRFGEKPSGWPKFILFLIIAGFCFSLLNYFYVLDWIAVKATGKHQPALFKQAPKEDDVAPKPAGGGGGGTTNAPAVEAK